MVSTSVPSIMITSICILLRGLYNGKYPPPPWGEGEISADVIWGKKYEKARRKRKRKKGKRKRKKGERKLKKGK